MPFGNPALGGVPGVWTGGYAGYAGRETPEDEDDEPTGKDPDGTIDTGVDEDDVPKKKPRKKGIAHYTEFRDKVSGLKEDKE